MLRMLAADAGMAMACLITAAWTAMDGRESSAGEPGAGEVKVRAAAGTKHAHAVISATKADLGKIPRGQRAVSTFVVVNTGEAPLELMAKSHCGCTVVEHDKVIPPGQQGTVTVEIASSSLNGSFQKSIQLLTSDPQRRVIQLTLSGTIVDAVEISPSPHPSVDLRMEGATVLALQLRTMEGVDVTGASCGEQFVETALRKTGDLTYQLDLKFGPAAPLGRSTLVVTLLTTGQHQREIPITVYCNKGILVTPKTLSFGRSRRNADATPTSMVMLAKHDGTFRIHSAQSMDPSVETRVVTLKEGTLYRVVATRRGESSVGESNSTIVVNTDDPFQPQLKIPIRSMSVPQVSQNP